MEMFLLGMAVGWFISNLLGELISLYEARREKGLHAEANKSWREKFEDQEAEEERIRQWNTKPEFPKGQMISEGEIRRSRLEKSAPPDE